MRGAFAPLLNPLVEWVSSLVKNRFLPGWSAVNTLSNSFAARATILIPLIGYLILFNEKMSDYLNLIGALNGNDSHYGVSFRLLNLYMGLCFIAAAVLVYSLRCPREIRGYSTASDFIAKVQGTISGPSLRVIEVQVASDPSMEHEFEGLRMVRVNTSGITVDTDKEQYIRGLLFLYFQLLDDSRRHTRVACLLLYVIGFALVSIPSIQVFVKVFRIFLTVLEQGARPLAN
jgi:hypothetical protein